MDRLERDDLLDPSENSTEATEVTGLDLFQLVLDVSFTMYAGLYGNYVYARTM